jgi:23S rRNA (cytidine1920-2'-O)/16S rRNA (cytidine1409-2'-O)-methyltransferase
MERTNARHVEKVPEPVRLVTIDASFISLKILLPVVKGWFLPSNPASLPQAEDGNVIALIKPQFEAGRKESARNKGVIREAEVHRAVLMDVLAFARAQGFVIRDLVRSPVLGPKGNVEFFAWLGMGHHGGMDLEILVTKGLVK